MVNFSDILKGNFVAEFSAITISEMLIAVVLSFVLSLFIVLIYRLTYAGVSYSRNFAGCLVMIAMVTAVVIQVITSNVVLSLGMVGALSIVRFRTAVKEPADTAFLFWAIATGIICGAGYVTVSILATLVLGVLFVGVYVFNRKGKSDTYMVVLRCEADCDADSKVSAMKGFKMKNKTMNANSTELVGEVYLSPKGMNYLKQMRSYPGVTEITIMQSVSGSVL